MAADNNGIVMRDTPDEDRLGFCEILLRNGQTLNLSGLTVEEAIDRMQALGITTTIDILAASSSSKKAHA